MPGRVDSNYPPPPPDDYGYGTGDTTDIGSDPMEYPPEGPQGPGDGYVPPEDGGRACPVVKSQDLADQLQAQYDTIKGDTTIPYDERNTLLKDLGDLIKKVKALPDGEPITADFQKDWDAFRASAAPAGGAVDANGDPVEADPNVQMKTDLEAYKEAIQGNPNLTDAKKTEYIGKIDQWLSGMELKTLDAESIQPQFDALKEEVTTASLHSPVVQSLSETTGLDPDPLENLFEKHGLDPANLPNPPDSKVAGLLNDPEFSSAIASDKEAVKGASTDLKSFIDTNVSAANALNASNQGSDTSVGDNMDGTSFQNLQNAYEHKDDKSAALTSARTKLATDVAQVLSSMYGTSVTSSSDPAKAGCIPFNGADMNVCPTSSTGDVSFGTSTDID